MTASKEAVGAAAAASIEDKMTALLRLENGGDTQGRRNEQVARSEAECQRFNALQDVCL